MAGARFGTRSAVVPRGTFHRENIDVRDKSLTLGIERAAAPIHAAEIARECDGSRYARRCENSFGSQLLHSSAAGVPILGSGSPGIVGRQSLRNEWWRCQGEGLRRRGFLGR